MLPGRLSHLFEFTQVHCYASVFVCMNPVKNLTSRIAILLPARNRFYGAEIILSVSDQNQIIPLPGQHPLTRAIGVAYTSVTFVSFCNKILLRYCCMRFLLDATRVPGNAPLRVGNRLTFR